MSYTHFELVIRLPAGTLDRSTGSHVSFFSRSVISFTIASCQRVEKRDFTASSNVLGIVIVRRTPSCARRRGQLRPCWPRSDRVSALERGRALDSARGAGMPGYASELFANVDATREYECALCLMVLRSPVNLVCPTEGCVAQCCESCVPTCGGQCTQCNEPLVTQRPYLPNRDLHKAMQGMCLSCPIQYEDEDIHEDEEMGRRRTRTRRR